LFSTPLWGKLKLNGDSVHVVVLVFLLPLSVAGFANSNSAFAGFVSTGTPHFYGIVHGKGATAEGFVGEIVAAFYGAGKFASLFCSGGFSAVFTGVFAVLSRSRFESHVGHS
jgi:F0F1-type ATP synthase assembly protein I